MYVYNPVFLAVSGIIQYIPNFSKGVVVELLNTLCGDPRQGKCSENVFLAAQIVSHCDCVETYTGVPTFSSIVYFLQIGVANW